MDALPNISPRMLAEELRACQAFFQESIDECAARNGFNAETPIVVEACPSNPDTFPIRPVSDAARSAPRMAQLRAPARSAQLRSAMQSTRACPRVG